MFREAQLANKELQYTETKARSLGSTVRFNQTIREPVICNRIPHTVYSESLSRTAADEEKYGSGVRSSQEIISVKNILQATTRAAHHQNSLRPF